ncbi:MAG: AMIN domain-containing protein, partial [Bacteroidetes bacterium]|nr:AMIN domain-containing protein [Bacteroidota bacterium]
MKKTIGLICTILLLTAGSSFAAAKVSNVELTWQDGFTVAHVDVQGAVRFSHQTEEAKDGRPFRVIVDILSATHNLGQKTFSDVPTCPVTNIRTSQFAVSPEKVVRLVFDMR